jgi:hypothetical protein
VDLVALLPRSDVAPAVQPNVSAAAHAMTLKSSLPPEDINGRSSTLGRGRDAYGDLLRDTRGLRREQQQARDTWFERLPWDRKADLLFELEVLLKGVACFANPRNHPGPPRRAPVVMQDFKEPLGVAREGAVQVVTLSRELLGDRDRAFVFQRYLETMLPEDTARTKLFRDSMSQNTPDEALFVLRHGLTNAVEVMDGLLRLPRVPFRLFYASLTGIQREIANNAYFNPLSALEFRPEFDRIQSRPVLSLIQFVPGEQAHRLVSLTFLSLFRMLRYLKLLESIVHEVGEGRKNPRRIYLVLAVLRSDARALSSYLRQRAGDLLAESFEADLLKVRASEIDIKHDALRAEGQRLINLRAVFEGVASTLRLEMRRTFEHDLPPPDSGAPIDEIRQRTLGAVANLRPALQNAIVFLARTLGARVDASGVFDERDARRISSERLRRDVWIFGHILRAFAAKATHTETQDDRWAGPPSLQFVREFLGYFRAMGYPLLRGSDYPRVDAFLEAMTTLSDAELLDPERLERAVEETSAFQQFLVELFENIGKRQELEGVPFDRRSAAYALKLYLGNGG